jgi:hypothetical protein
VASGSRDPALPGDPYSPETLMAVRARVVSSMMSSSVAATSTRAIPYGYSSRPRLMWTLPLAALLVSRLSRTIVQSSPLAATSPSIVTLSA